MRPSKAQVHGGSWRIIDKRDRTITTSSYINSTIDKREVSRQGSKASDGEASSSICKEVDLQQDNRTDENNEPTYTRRDEIQESESEESPAWNVMHGSLNMCIEAISRLERDNTDCDRISLEGILHLLKGVLHTSQELKQQSFQKRKEEGKMISLVSSLREVCAKQKRVIKSMKAAEATDRNLFACSQSTQTDESIITIVEPQYLNNNDNNDNSNSGFVESEGGTVGDSHHVNRANRSVVTRTLDHTNLELKSISLNKLQELKYSSEHELLVDQLVQAQNNSSIQGTMMKILQSKLDRLEGQLSSYESKLQEEKKRADSTMRVVLSLESIVEKQRAIISSSSSLSTSHSHSGYYSKKEQKDSSSSSGRKPSVPPPMK